MVSERIKFTELEQTMIDRALTEDDRKAVRDGIIRDRREQTAKPLSPNEAKSETIDLRTPPSHENGDRRRSPRGETRVPPPPRSGWKPLHPRPGYVSPSASDMVTPKSSPTSSPPRKTVRTEETPEAAAIAAQLGAIPPVP